MTQATEVPVPALVEAEAGYKAAQAEARELQDRYQTSLAAVKEARRRLEHLDGQVETAEEAAGMLSRRAELKRDLEALQAVADGLRQRLEAATSRERAAQHQVDAIRSRAGHIKALLIPRQRATVAAKQRTLQEAQRALAAAEAALAESINALQRLEAEYFSLVGEDA